MSEISLKQVVQDYGGYAAVHFANTGKLSVKNDLCGGDYGDQTISLRDKLEELRNVLWGVADLHSHPASNFGFGAEDDGKGGIIWGIPGTKHYSNTNLHVDIPMCNSIHSHDVYEPRTTARRLLLSVLDPHNGHIFGPPDFHDWPSALSPSHQQMHITWIRRAWSGGLRLMVASTVNNQLLHRLWHLPDIPHVDPEFDFFSAMIQLDQIKKIVEANSSWMQIVKTADEAYQAIKDNKLAVVLAVEMDQLTVQQIIHLKNNSDVRLVTPIHLADNSFGGAAVYEDLFDLLNRFLNNGQGFVTVPDDSIEFHLWKDISDAINALLEFISNFVQLNIGLNTSDGTKNSIGLKSDTGLLELMKEGLIIDVHHMSEKCITDTIDIADIYKYPLVKTHTGLRPDPESDDKADNENSLSHGHAQDIMELYGMIGLGTGYKEDVERTINDWLRQYKELAKIAKETGREMSVGIGTDINGLDKHIDHSESELDIKSGEYPLEIPCRNLGNHQHPESIGSMMLTMPGCWNFKDKGLAHYGFIPEFLYAVDKLDKNGPHIHNLFSSAHAFVKMWKLVEEAKGRVP